MRERQAMIEQQVKDADEAKQKLAEAESAFQNALKEARTEAAQIRENARAEAQRTIEELRQQAQEESARIIARGEEQLARQRTRSCANCAPRSARWPSSCPRRSSISGWPTTRRSARPSTRSSPVSRHATPRATASEADPS